VSVAEGANEATSPEQANGWGSGRISFLLFWFPFAKDLLSPIALLVLVIEVLAVSADAGVRALGGAGDVSAAVIRDPTSGVWDQLFGTLDCRALGLDANVSSAFGNAVCAFGFDSARNHVAIKLRAPAVFHLTPNLHALNVGVEAVGVANNDDSSGVGNSQRRLFGSTGVQFWRHSSCRQDAAVGSEALDSGAFDLGAIDVEAEGLVLDCVVLVSFEGVVFVTHGNVTVLRERKSDGVSPAFLAIGRRGRCRRTGSRWFFVDFNAYVVLFGLDGSKTCDEDAEDKQLHFVVLAS